MWIFKRALVLVVPPISLLICPFPPPPFNPIPVSYLSLYNYILFPLPWKLPFFLLVPVIIGIETHISKSLKANIHLIKENMQYVSFFFLL